MFGSLKIFLTNLLGDRGSESQANNRDGRLVTAALLTRVATVHSEMSEGRRVVLHAMLRSKFGLDDRATARLLEEAAVINRNAIDIYQFVRKLNEIIDDDGRGQIVRMMWEIVYAEGHVNELETNIIWRAADLLGVTSRQRLELRQRVLVRRPVLA
jgi:uncharacterized tellurite resistance protein B-like protein